MYICEYMYIFMSVVFVCTRMCIVYEHVSHVHLMCICVFMYIGACIYMQLCMSMCIE